MKAKWLWLLIPVALTVLAAALCRSPGGGGPISARFVGQTLDSTGRVHVVYEVTNGTSSAIDLWTSLLEERHERTGWWDVDKWSVNLSGGSDGWLTAWHLEKRDGVAKSARQLTLNAGRAAQLTILAPRLTGNGSAVRGKLWQIKLEGRAVTQVRSIASHLGLPRRWLMWPKPGLIDLPEA